MPYFGQTVGLKYLIIVNLFFFHFFKIIADITPLKPKTLNLPITFDDYWKSPL